MDKLFEAFLPPNATGRSVFAEWLLSWYADDFVPNASSVIRQPFWNSRDFWRNYSTAPYPLPNFTLAGADVAQLSLGAIDARFIELELGAGSSLILSGVLPLRAVGRIGLVLLRR